MVNFSPKQTSHLLLNNPTLYFVTPEIGENIEKWENIIYNAVLGGVKILQIRDKICSAQTMIAAARRIHPFLKKRGVPLLINDRVDIAHAIHADGVHLGQSDVKVAEARAILGNHVIVGLSVETIQQAMDAMHENISYLAASPVFATKTKIDCRKPWEIDDLKHLCSISHHPIVAIGGIDATNVEAILECGVLGIAVVSAIFKAPCPKTAAKHILNKMKNCR